MMGRALSPVARAHGLGAGRRGEQPALGMGGTAMMGRALSPFARAHGLGGPAAGTARAGNGAAMTGWALSPVARTRGLGAGRRGAQPAPEMGAAMTSRAFSLVVGARGLGAGRRRAQLVPAGALVRFVAAPAGGGADRAEVVRPAAVLRIILRLMAGFHRAARGHQVLAAGDIRYTQSALLAVSPPAGLAGVVAVPPIAPAA